MLLQNDPAPSARPSVVYLLRIWRGGQPGQTRFRLEDVATRQGILFEDVQALMDFLVQQLKESLLDE